MNRFTWVGAILLVAASLTLIGSAAYVERALRNPAAVIIPFPNTVAFYPSLGPVPIAAVALLEHLLVGSALWFLRRGAGRPTDPSPA